MKNTVVAARLTSYETDCSSFIKKIMFDTQTGKIVSKKAQANGKKAYKRISKWTAAVQKARKALNIKGFQAVGGKSAKGQVSALLCFYCDKFSTRITYIEVYPVDSSR